MKQELIEELTNAKSMGAVMDAFNKVENIGQVGEFIDLYGSQLGDREKAIENITFGVSYCDSPHLIKLRLDLWKKQQQVPEMDPDTGWDELPPTTEDPFDESPEEVQS